MNIMELSHYLALIIGSGALIIGVIAVLKPEAMSKKFGIPVTGPALPYVISTGVRDIFIGLTVLILFYRQEWFTLGCINLAVGVVAITDFILVLKHGDKKISIVHFLGALLFAGYGFWLIYN